MHTHHFVYLGLQKGQLKIGHTWNPSIRVKQHSRKNGSQFKLIGLLAIPLGQQIFGVFDGESKAKKIEEDLLKKTIKWQIKGEWREFSEDILRIFESIPGAIICE